MTLRLLKDFWSKEQSEHVNLIARDKFFSRDWEFFKLRVNIFGFQMSDEDQNSLRLFSVINVKITLFIINIISDTSDLIKTVYSWMLSLVISQLMLFDWTVKCSLSFVIFEKQASLSRWWSHIKKNINCFLHHLFSMHLILLRDLWTTDKQCCFSFFLFLNSWSHCLHTYLKSLNDEISNLMQDLWILSVKCWWRICL